MKQQYITALVAITLATAAVAQTVERVQLKDGQFADWRTTTSVTREIKPGCTETTENITEAALVGQPAQTIQRTTTREKTGTGEIVRTTETTRNTFGKQTGQRLVEETTQREPDGSVSVRVIERAPNANNEVVLQREEQRRIIEVNQTTTLIESQIRSHDNLRGRFDLTAIQSTQVEKKGDTTRTETTTRRTVGDQDRVVSRVVSTETKAADGNRQRETVEYGQGLHNKMSYLTTGELKPQRKIVERTETKPGGGTVLTREIFRLDLNGEWKPVPHGWAPDQAP
jgi:hypothetical protein